MAQRFIPAPAGNGSLAHLEWWEMAVHPRACGEREIIIYAHDISHGSSPRLRGTVKDWVGEWIDLRFIPAPAGNGQADISSGANLAVHPRACGERDILSNYI